MDETQRRTDRTADAMRRAIGRPAVYAPRLATVKPAEPEWIRRARAGQLFGKDLTR